MVVVGYNQSVTISERFVDRVRGDFKGLVRVGLKVGIISGCAWFLVFLCFVILGYWTGGIAIPYTSSLKVLAGMGGLGGAFGFVSEILGRVIALREGEIWVRHIGRRGYQTVPVDQLHASFDRPEPNLVRVTLSRPRPKLAELIFWLCPEDADYLANHLDISNAQSRTL